MPREPRPNRSPPHHSAGSISVLAIDVGTTSTKAAVIDADGTVAALAQTATPCSSPLVARREHDAIRLWQATLATIRRAASEAKRTGRSPAAISVTGARGSVCVLDDDGRSLGPFMTWQDRRAEPQMPMLEDRLGGTAQLYRQTGVRLDPSLAGAKLAWLRDHDPQTFERARWAASTQGYVVSRLIHGAPYTDLATANYFGMLDLKRLEWSRPLAEGFGVPFEMLPPICPPGAIVGSLHTRLADRLELGADTPIVLAGADGLCAELGAGVVDERDAYGYVGTASSVASPLTFPRLDSEQRVLVGPGATAGRWRALALGLAGAGAADWWRGIVALRSPRALDEVLSRTSPGARGVVFLPALSGTATPHWERDARAMFVGLSLGHGGDDLARAVCEGVALEMRSMIDALRTFGCAPSMLRLTGGGARSDHWSQLLADVVDLEVMRVRHPEPALLGNAAFALSALGCFPDTVAAATYLRAPVDRFEPRADLGALYTELAGAHSAVRRAFAEHELDGRLRRLSERAGSA